MYILGISAFYHESAAAIIKDGVVLVAIEEERLSRIKHDNSFPKKAVNACLKFANIKASDLSGVAYYEKPLLKFERILHTFTETYPFSVRPFIEGIPEWINQKIKVEEVIRKNLNFKGPVFFLPHHLSHAASAYLNSPFKKAAVLSIDGVGEYETTTLWQAQGDIISPLKSIHFPDSLGLFFAAFTSYLGFRINDSEYKVMGMAALGRKKYVKKIHKTIKVFADGSFKLNMEYFAFRESFRMWSGKFEDLFGKARSEDKAFMQKHFDIAASLQFVTEEIYFKILNHLYLLTKTDNLCIGGGLGLNALANGKIYKNTPFKNIYIFGPCGDSGSAVGAALYAYRNLLEGKKHTLVKSLMLGLSYSDWEVEKILKQNSINYKKFRNEKELINTTAHLLAKGKIIGWFQGRAEYGPRSLGARSILSKPNPYSMKDKVNKIKIREEFRPFAGSILKEEVADFFEVPEKNHSAPFMNFCFPVKKEKRKILSAITHQDGTCRIQTVSRNDGKFYKLIKKFHQLTGIPCLLNTSFNLKGEPIVESPAQAVDDFLKTDLEYLVIGNFIVSKE